MSTNHNLFEVGLWYSRGRVKVKAGTTAQHPTVAVPYEYFLWFEGSHKRIHNNNNNIPMLFAEKFLITVCSQLFFGFTVRLTLGVIVLSSGSF